MKTWKIVLIVWLHGILAAFITGSAAAVTLVVADPTHFNFFEGFPELWKATVLSGVLAAAGYLKKSPVPEIPIGEPAEPLPAQDATEEPKP